MKNKCAISNSYTFQISSGIFKTEDGLCTLATISDWIKMGETLAQGIDDYIDIMNIYEKIRDG